MSNTFATNFLTHQQAEALVAQHDAPLYAYSEKVLRQQAAQALSVDAPFGLTVRYAMKANPHPDILRVLRSMDIKIDASSAYEVDKALASGFEPEDILLTSQELARNLHELVGKGVQFTACSLRQLEEFGKLFPGHDVAVRINPGIGSGRDKKNTTGGPASSFGIWHEYVPQVLALAKKCGLPITRLHTHIGSGVDPQKWADAVDITLGIVEKLPDVTTVDIGGGFKVGRMDGEHSADMADIGQHIRDRLLAFAERTGRKLHLEIEPGTFMVANVGIIVAQVEDVVDTGADGYKFIKLNTGMTEILRPSLYAAQQPIAILNDAAEEDDFVVVGHCCESGDLLTTAPGDSQQVATRRLPVPQPGDIALIGGAGAYCASLAAHGYNSFPLAAEVLV